MAEDIMMQDTRPDRNVQEPDPSPQKIKEEYITQRMKLWFSKAEEITVVDARLRASPFSFDSSITLGAPEMNKPACLIPFATGDGYIYVPRDNSFEGVSDSLKAETIRIDLWARQPRNAATMEAVEKLLDEEIEKECFWKFLDSDKSLGDDIARMAFPQKVEMCAKYRLMNVRDSSVIKNFIKDMEPGPFNGPYLFSEPPLSNIGIQIQNIAKPNNEINPPVRFRFIVVDVDKFGQISMTWRALPWHCTMAEFRAALEDFSKLSYIPKDVLNQFQDLEGITGSVGASFSSNGQGEMSIDQPKTGEGPKTKAGDSVWKITWVVGASALTDNDSLPIRRNIEVGIHNRSLGDDGLVSMKIGDQKWFNMDTAKEFTAMLSIARGGGGWPLLMRSWQLNHYMATQKALILQARDFQASTGWMGEDDDIGKGSPRFPDHVHGPPGSTFKPSKQTVTDPSQDANPADYGGFEGWMKAANDEWLEQTRRRMHAEKEKETEGKKKAAAADSSSYSDSGDSDDLDAYIDAFPHLDY